MEHLDGLGELLADDTLYLQFAVTLTLAILQSLQAYSGNNVGAGALESVSSPQRWSKRLRTRR